MIARIKHNGIYIEVEKIDTRYKKIAQSSIYKFNEQFLYDEDELEIMSESGPWIIEGWVCRDECIDKRHDTDLWLCVDNYKPSRCWNRWYASFGCSIPLPIKMFPEVTWQTKPKKVRITITPIEE